MEKKELLKNLKAVWNEHSDDDWGEFEKEEVCRYICSKIALGAATFLTEKQETEHVRYTE